MVFYVDEKDIWECPNHPSKRRHSGICPVCLRDKLASLCPDCANLRPCPCCATCSASSSSSSFSRFTTATDGDISGVGAVGRVSNLIQSEPAFRQSRSLSIPFFRSKPESLREKNVLAGNKCTTPSFWSIFRASNKSKRYESEDHQRDGEKERITAEEKRRRMMRKSRSVAVRSHSGDSKPSSSTKGKSWYLPSPMKVFRQTRVSKLVFQEHSPLYRDNDHMEDRERTEIIHEQLPQFSTINLPLQS